MKTIKTTALQALQGGVCIAPQNAQGNICLPCAAIIAMGSGLGPGGASNLICPL